MTIIVGEGITIESGVTITGTAGAPLGLNTIAAYLRNYVNVDSTSGGLRNPNFYNYNLDGDEYYISDGGGDMFDGGNYTAPSLISNTTYLNSSSIPVPPTLSYNTTTAAITDTNFWYVSLGYSSSPERRPLTMLGARSVTGSPIGFQKAGNIGADGGGSISYNNLYTGQIFNGFTTYAFFRQTYANGDPTICDLYILLGHNAWNSVFGTVENVQDTGTQVQGAQFRTYGAGTQNVLAITTLLSVNDNSAIATGTLQTIVQNYTFLIGQALGI